MAALLSLLTCAVARADEGGASFWLPGQYSALAAVPPAPGWYLPANLYYYSGNASASKTFQIGVNVVADLDARSAMMFVGPTYATETKVLGGQPSLSLTWVAGGVKVTGDVQVSPRDLGVSRSDTQWGGGDLYPLASLSWNQGNDNWMTYLTGDIPVGAYDSKRLANIGLGHGAIDAGGAYTYLNMDSGHEFTAVAGVTYNAENSSTNYKNGVDSHLDWGASQFLSANWQAGLVGYVYYQLTNDSGSGDTSGGFKSRVASVGPEVGYLFKVGGKEAYLNVRGYWEFWAQNRTEGYALFATLNLPLGGKN